MYNLWWVLIGLGILTILGIVFTIICNRKESEYHSLACWEIMFYISLVFTIVCGIALLCIIPLSIELPLKAKREYKEYLYNRQMIEMMYNSGGNIDFKNVGLNNKIIEVNQWVSQAKASKAQYGNWSKYCVIDVDGLEYILLDN